MNQYGTSVGPFRLEPNVEQVVCVIGSTTHPLRIWGFGAASKYGPELVPVRGALRRIPQPIVGTTVQALPFELGQIAATALIFAAFLPQEWIVHPRCPSLIPLLFMFREPVYVTLGEQVGLSLWAPQVCDVYAFVDHEE